MVSQSCLDSSLQENWSIAFAVRHPIPILVLICSLRMCQHAESIEKQLHVKQMTYTQSLDVSLFCAIVCGKINVTSSQPVAVPRSVPQSETTACVLKLGHCLKILSCHQTRKYRKANPQLPKSVVPFAQMRLKRTKLLCVLNVRKINLMYVLK